MQSLRRSLRGSVHQRRDPSNASPNRKRMLDALNIEAGVSPSRGKGNKANRPRANTDITNSHIETPRLATADNQVTPVWFRVHLLSYNPGLPHLSVDITECMGLSPGMSLVRVTDYTVDPRMPWATAMAMV